jgi:DNA-binding SARP family transcriptional activator
MLLLSANEVVSTERLIEGLWEEPPARPVKAVQVYVSRLRGVLGGTMPVSKPPGYMLRLDPEQFDLARFRRMRDEHAGSDPASAADRLKEALALWRGQALAEFVSEPFARAERLRLEEERLEAVEKRIEAELALGRHAALVGELEALVAAQPLRESLRGQLMLALYRCGRRAEALAVYREGRLRLVEELGIEPGRALQRLEMAILSQDQSLDLARDEVAAESRRGIFVGRDRELHELSEGVSDAFAGHGRLFLLVGEPGIGKSWLAAEVLGRARARGARVLVGRCWEAGGAPAYWPWVQSLRACLHSTAPEKLRQQLGAGGPALAPLFPELRELIPDLSERPTPESDSARFRLFDAVSSFLRAAASARPIALLLDDLHAADEPSLLLLRFVAREMSGSRMLILGAYRDVEPTIQDPLSTALGELLREPVTTRIQLAGLSEPEVAEYLSRSTNSAPSGGLAAQIHAETEGNPLFVAEVARLLQGAGMLDPGTTVSRLGIPQGVQDVIGRRLRCLSPGSLRVLTAASILGREFSLGALARLSGLAGEALVETLDEAVAERLVGEVPGAPGYLRFTHVLIRDTLYQGLSGPRRLWFHRQAGEVLEALYADGLETHLAELAHHFAAAAPAGDAGKAVSYARRAADWATVLLAFEEAARLYRLALGLTEGHTSADRGQRCELLLALADVQARAGDMPAAQDTCLDAAALAEGIGSSELLARAALGYGGRLLFARATDRDRLVPLLERAAQALGPKKTPLRVRILARHANAISQSLPEKGSALSAEALAIARELEDPATLAYAISARLYATRAPTNLEERWRLTGELIQAADSEQAFEGHAYRTIVLFARGDIPGVRADLSDMGRLAEQLTQPSQRWWVAVTSATLALLEGRFDEAEKLIDYARTQGEYAQGYDARNFYQLQRFALCREQGRLAEVLADLELAAGADPSRPLLRCALAMACWELGRRDDARRLVDQLAHDGFAELPVNNDWLLSAALLAEFVASTGDRSRAKALSQRLAPYNGLNVDTEEVSTGAVSRYLGLLAATAGRFDQAVHHFEDALAMNQAMGALPWTARTQHDYAQLLLARNTAGNGRRARELLGAARATYRELHMHPYRLNFTPTSSQTQRAARR